MTTVGYAHAAAFDSGFLPVGEIHKLHYEQYGKLEGKPGKVSKSTKHSFEIRCIDLRSVYLCIAHSLIIQSSSYMEVQEEVLQ